MEPPPFQAKELLLWLTLATILVKNGQGGKEVSLLD